MKSVFEESSKTRLKRKLRRQPIEPLSQAVLDFVAVELMEDGDDDPDLNGLIERGVDGPVWPILIGKNTSKRLIEIEPEEGTSGRNQARH